MADNFETDECRQTEEGQLDSHSNTHRYRGWHTTLKQTSVDRGRQTGSYSNTHRHRSWQTTLKQTSIDRQRKTVTAVHTEADNIKTVS